MITPLVFSLLLASTTAFGATQKVLLLGAPVKVTAQPISDGILRFNILVEYGGDRFIVPTVLFPNRENPDAILKKLKQSVGWKGGYLFVQSDCGGGNAWRCPIEHVFALRGGKLIYVGEALGSSSSGNRPGGSFQKGWFKDRFDKLEINSLNCHACAPSFSIIMRERDGRFQVDLEKTWKENRKQFDWNIGNIRSVLAKALVKRDDHDLEMLRDALLANAVLAHYSKRNKEFENTLNLAGKNLDPETFKKFQQLIADVVPGEVMVVHEREWGKERRVIHEVIESPGQSHEI